jgi:hypothetical protein
MRFFTRDWANGALPDDDADRVPELYAQHIAALRDRLPARVREFVAQVNLHDGLVRDLALDEQARTLHLRIRAGDQQVGYYDADLLYMDVTVNSHTVGILHKMRRDRRYELLCDELDIDERGHVLHRLMFWPEDEVTIEFRELSWRRIPRPERWGEGAG